MLPSGKTVHIREVQRLVKRVFDEAIIGTYREVLQTAVASVGGNPGAIALKLRKHKGLLSRWRSGKVVPNWETLCLAVAAFDVDLGDDLPRGRRAVTEAIKRTLNVLRAQLFHNPTSSLDDGDLVCLHYASLSLQWWHAQQTRKPDHLIAATESLARKVAAEIPGKRISRHEDVEDAIRGWSKCWFVFHYVVPYDWQYPTVATHATNIG